MTDEYTPTADEVLAFYGRLGEVHHAPAPTHTHTLVPGPLMVCTTCAGVFVTNSDQLTRCRCKCLRLIHVAEKDGAPGFCRNCGPSLCAGFRIV